MLLFDLAPLALGHAGRHDRQELVLLTAEMRDQACAQQIHRSAKVCVRCRGVGLPVGRDSRRDLLDGGGDVPVVPVLPAGAPGSLLATVDLLGQVPGRMRLRVAAAQDSYRSVLQPPSSTNIR